MMKIQEMDVLQQREMKFARIQESLRENLAPHLRTQTHPLYEQRRGSG